MIATCIRCGQTAALPGRRYECLPCRRARQQARIRATRRPAPPPRPKLCANCRAPLASRRRRLCDACSPDQQLRERHLDNVRRVRERERRLAEWKPNPDPVMRAVIFCRENFGPSTDMPSCLDERFWVACVAVREA